MKVRSALLAAATLSAMVASASLAPVAHAGSAPRLDSRGLGVMIPSHAKSNVNGSQDSLNWSGYVVNPTGAHQVTAVNSTFVVPAVNSTTPGFAATWTGIGGDPSADLIQAGISEQFAPGFGPSYGAWYEILPAAETPISGCSNDPACTVNAGDTVSVSITESGLNHWLISITDTGHWTYSTSLNYTSTHSSAEWILEAPTVGAQTVMPSMGNAVFDPGNSFALDGGAAQNFSTGNPTITTMNTFEGTPSAIDGDGDGFTACAYKLSCPTPSS